MSENRKKLDEKANQSKNTPPQKKYVSNVGIVSCTIYLIAIGFIILNGLIAFWPPSSLETVDPGNSDVIFLKNSFEISNEIRLIIIVALAGALGSLVHTFRSLFWYVGNRELVRSWILMYILLPFIGATLGLIFYFVLRGGLFTTQAPVQAANPFGFAGLAGLVGMFSNQAALKLQEIAETMFSTKESTEGKDHVPADSSATQDGADNNDSKSKKKD